MSACLTIATCYYQTTSISNVLQIENVLKPVINGGHKLLIIASCSANVMNTLSANVVRNGLKLCQIEPPQFGYKRHELMNDIAVATGGKYFAEETGDDLNLIRMEDLGKIDKVIAGRDETIMIGGHGDEGIIKERVKELKAQKDKYQGQERGCVYERAYSLLEWSDWCNICRRQLRH